MKPPLVSIIIPTYNRPAFLKEAVDSVYAQSYKEFEIIVIDDGSTDNTAQIAAQYDERLCYIHQSNQGVAAARNRGIKEAQGEYIAFLDDDDVYEPSKLQENLVTMQQHPDVAWLYSGFSFIDAQGALLERDPIIPEKEVITLHDIALFTFIATPSVMVRAQAIIDAGGFPEGVKVSEDYDTWARILAKGKGVALKSQLVKIRLHKGNTPLSTIELLKQNTQIIDFIMDNCTSGCQPRAYYMSNLHRIIADSLRHKKQYIRYILFRILARIST